LCVIILQFALAGCVLRYNMPSLGSVFAYNKTKEDPRTHGEMLLTSLLFCVNSRCYSASVSFMYYFFAYEMVHKDCFWIIMLASAVSSAEKCL
jgi:hypothetical protein